MACGALLHPDEINLASIARTLRGNVKPGDVHN